jgi:hypothetical protein
MISLFRRQPKVIYTVTRDRDAEVKRERIARWKNTRARQLLIRLEIERAAL